MAERVSLIDASDKDFQQAVESALRYLRAGEVIIAAAEHGYVYLANAFDKDAVNAIQILRTKSPKNRHPVNDLGSSVPQRKSSLEDRASGWSNGRPVGIRPSP